MEILTTMITPYKKDGSIDFDTAEVTVDMIMASEPKDEIEEDVETGKKTVKYFSVEMDSKE